jgi:hypothetical protein
LKEARQQQRAGKGFHHGDTEHTEKGKRRKNEGLSPGESFYV